MIDHHPKQMGRVRVRTERRQDQKAEENKWDQENGTLSEIDGPFVLVEEYGDEF